MLIHEFGAFIVFAVITNVASFAVKMQVNSTVPREEQFSWWNWYTSEVGKKHRELFPGSSLPYVARYSYWICLLLFAAMILGSFYPK